jgi:hypothetical protein
VDNVVKRHLMLIRKMISQVSLACKCILMRFNQSEVPLVPDVIAFLQMRWMPSVELRRKHLNEVKKEAQAVRRKGVHMYIIL